MDINLLDYVGDGTFRPYTLNTAVHEILKSLPVGAEIIVSSVTNVKKEKTNLATFRASLNHVKKKAMREILLVTESDQFDYPVRIYRAK